MGVYNKKLDVKIENGKIIFSNSVLNYFEKLKDNETSQLIDEYFEILKDDSNINASKFRKHHIIPVFVFKDENHKNRKQAKPLADKIEGNLIKVSVYNHIRLHYLLWKIFNNIDSKIAFQRMCGQENTSNLSKEEIYNIAKLKEDCAKENQTKEERELHLKEYNKIWKMNHKEDISEYNKIYRELNLDDVIKATKNWRENNKDKIKKYNEFYKKEHKEKVNEYSKNYKKLHKNETSKYNKNYRELNRDDLIKKQKDTDSKICEDPIKNEKCTYGALKTRKYRNKELYKNVILSDCIIENKIA